MRYRYLILIFMCLAWGVSSFAWGPKGHDIIAEIASRHVSKKTAKKISEVLEGKSMVYYSSWMDGIRGIPRYAHTYSWHFLNVDPGYTYDTAPHDPRGDVYNKTLAVIDSLKSGSLSHEQEKDHLRYLIHMMGDLHCLMHVGYAYDLGGNRRKVYWFSEQTNLHSVWDSKLLESSRKWGYGEWADNIDVKDSKTLAAITNGDVAVWRDDVLSRVGKAYDAAPEDSQLGYPYINAFSEELEYLLLCAGIRLAYVLDDIYDR